ncbi:transposase [Streptococcus varani]|uniref:Transposase n=1 Tax=Streptococcus varani TaxID=1608583 RepID=A0A0E4H455_9STRE|nr:transposase [Streptococcus varani]
MSEACAATVLAEIGPNVDSFETDGHLASWAGLCPGSYESAGIKKSSHITQGNRYIKQALTMSGLIAAHSKDPAFSSLYNRISQRGSKMKAVIACAHKILRTIYKLVEAMNGKLSLEDRFLLNQSLEEYRMYQELMDKLTSEIQTYIAKEFP